MVNASFIYPAWSFVMYGDHVSTEENTLCAKPWMSSLHAELAPDKLGSPGKRRHSYHKLPGGHRAQRLCWPLCRSRSCRGAPPGVLYSPSTTLWGQTLLWQVIHYVALDFPKILVHPPSWWPHFVWVPRPHLNCFQNVHLDIRLVWVEIAEQSWQKSSPSLTEQMHIWETIWHALPREYHWDPNFWGQYRNRSIGQNLHGL